MATAGVSTLGVTLGYGAQGTNGAKPSSYTTLTRINSIGGISLDPEQIDASALEDSISKYVAGRSDTGGSWTVTINVTNETISEWTTAISTANGEALWFKVLNPDLTYAINILAYVPTSLPVPEIGQNELETMEINLTVENFDITAITP